MEDDRDGFFDIDSFASEYHANAVFQRLRFICEKSEGDEARKQEALRAMRRVLSERTEQSLLSHDVFVSPHLVSDVLRAINEPIDESFLQKIQRVVSERQGSLTTNLNSSRTNQIRESIRVSYIEFGDFYVQLQEPEAALKYYNQARDFSISPQHVYKVNKKIVFASILSRRLAGCSVYISAMKSCAKTPSQQTSALIAEALSLLEDRKYSEAVSSLLRVDTQLLSSTPRFLSQKDLAKYITILLLATYSRSQLIEAEANLGSFLQYLPEARSLIASFVNNDFTSFFALLSKFRTILELDIHMHNHVEKLFQNIWEKSAIAYLKPFENAKMDVMAQAFGVSLQTLEDGLSKLILSGSLPFRLDLCNLLLLKDVVDPRMALYQKTLEFGEQSNRTTLSYIVASKLQLIEGAVQANSSSSSSHSGSSLSSW